MSEEDRFDTAVHQLRALPVTQLYLVYDLLDKLAANPDEWADWTQQFLHMQNPWSVKNWSTWKTVTVGTMPESIEDRLKNIAEVGIRLDHWGGNILKRIAPAAPEEIELVLVTNAELGLPCGWKVSETFANAKAGRLLPVPAEVGYQLRLDYPDQPLGERILVGMDPVASSYDSSLVFSVARNEFGVWLGAVYGRPGGFFNCDCKWVFARMSSGNS